MTSGARWAGQATRHERSVKRDGVRYWYWHCSCGVEGASWTTPAAAKEAYDRYHNAAQLEQDQENRP